jgi:HK97 gp10 family phage protein
MARNSTIVELDTRKLNALIRKIPGNVADAVAATAFAIERQAKINAPVDTGALRNSIYSRVGKSGGNHTEAAASVASARPGTQMGVLPEPENATTAYVGPGVEYAVYVELGTSKRGAQPFLLPAVRAVESSLADKFGGIAD